MRNKLVISYLFVFIMTLGLLPVLDAGQEDNNNTKIEASQNANFSDSAIRPLTVIRKAAKIQSVGGIKPYDDYWYNSKINVDLSDKLGLAYSLSVSNITEFLKPVPDGYDKTKLIEWGKYPGLNVDILHKHGFTGKGAVIAYIDHPFIKHEQYSDSRIHYKNNTNSDNSMHGPAVLSLLVGKDIGTAPEAEIYFYADGAWDGDQTHQAECLYQIIEQNKSLPEGKKIRMVGFSDNIDESDENADAFRKAVKACDDAGVMVWFCGEYGPASFIPYADKNNYVNLMSEHWWKMGNPRLVFIPTGSRTTAATMGGAEYTYWAGGGLSWAMPYALGLYAIAIEIDPNLNQDELRKMIVDTAYVDGFGRRIVNPVGFVASALKRVGRNEEAQEMLDEAKNRTKYLYAVIDTAKMKEKELTEIGDCLASITEATVLIVDSAKFSDNQSIYSAIQNDAKQRGGIVVGLKGFNESSIIPTFQIGVIEPNTVCSAISDSKGYIINVPTDICKPVQWQCIVVPIILSDGKPKGNPKEVNFTTENELVKGDNGTIHKFLAQPLDNGYTRFTISYSMSKKMGIKIYESNHCLFRFEGNTGEKYANSELVFDLKNEDLISLDNFKIVFYYFYSKEKVSCYHVFIKTSQFK